jgi:phosphatidylglycerol:prolipoprotein diacylglycerol transferase
VSAIDPIITTVAGVHVWWYGLGFAFGFLHVHLFLRGRRDELGLTRRQVHSLTLAVVVGVLAGGRFVEVAFDEWPFFREHLDLIPAYWLGGMATHGLLLGAAIGAGLFALVSGTSFRMLADALVVPGALLMGLGRLGNFIDGQIVGHVTDVPWAVKFPDASGFRHPVVLYDGLKNLLLVPYLRWSRRANPTPGATAARFVFWYASLRIVADLFRDYPTHRLALGTGQTLNILMTLLGMGLLIRSRLRRLGRLGGSSVARGATSRPAPPDVAPRLAQRVALAVLLIFCLTIPSNWTQDVPARYGTRHPGLEHSWLYPPLDTRPRAR